MGSSNACRVEQGELIVSLGPYQPRAFAVRLGEPPVKLTQPATRLVDLPYDLDVVSLDRERGGGDFDGQGNSLAGDLLPQTVVHRGIPYVIGPRQPGKPNALACRGQHLPLPEGDYDRVYILGASVGEGTKPGRATGVREESGASEEQAETEIAAGAAAGAAMVGAAGSAGGTWAESGAGIATGGGKAGAAGGGGGMTARHGDPGIPDPGISTPWSQLLPDWSAPVGQWDSRIASGVLVEDPQAIPPGWIDPSPVAWAGTHRHGPQGENQAYTLTRLFCASFEIPAGARDLLLPDEPGLRILAVTVARNPNAAIRPCQPLYDVEDGAR